MLPFDSEFPLYKAEESVGELTPPHKDLRSRYRRLVQTDVLGHVTVGLDDVQIALGIAVVGAPAGGARSNVVVGFAALGGTVVSVTEGGVISEGDQIHDDSAIGDLFNGLLVLIQSFLLKYKQEKVIPWPNIH